MPSNTPRLRSHLVLLSVVFMALGVALILWHLRRQETALYHSMALQGTTIQLETIRQIREIYSSEVVKTAQAAGLEVTHDYVGKERAIPLPATLTMQLGDAITRARPGAYVRLFSDHPFPWRKDSGGARDAFEAEALIELRRNPDVPFYRFEDFQGTPSLRFAVADRMRASCVNCHNTRPDSPKKDWKVGDVRGVLEFIRPLDNHGIAAAKSAEKRDSVAWTFGAVVIVFGIGLLGLGQAMRSVRRSSDSLLESESRVRSVIDTALDAVVTMDASGIITGWNPQAETIFGWKSGEAVGRGMGEIVLTSHEGQSLNGDFAQLLARGDVITSGRRLEIVAQRRDGREFPAELAISPAKVAGQTTYSVFIRDISEAKHAAEQLLHAKEAAEAANRAKSEFLANMSHEIRTPMNGVIGMTELVMDTDLTQEQRGYVEIVKNSADSLLGIINDILDFSKIEAGKLDLDPIHFDLIGALDETIGSLAFRAHQKGLELAYQVSPEVPTALVGDPGRVRQIIINLVNNAVKFTETGEVVLRVDRESRENDRVLLHFTVIDTGIGIPPEKQDKIFEAFTQVDASMTRRFGGTGLGLTITAQLVRLMGGKIWVESQVGQGSRFHCVLPFEVRPEPAAKPPLKELADLRDARVLVVDDNATNRRILDEILTNWGMQPTVVDGGEAALQAMLLAHKSARPFSLVLLDYQMPGMDGFETAGRIKQSSELAAVTIMMLSSVGQRGDAARCRDTGIAAYLTKPVRQSVLLDAILTVLAKSNKQEESSMLVTRHSLSEANRPLHILLAEDNAVNKLVAVRMLEKGGHKIEVANDGREAVEAVAREHYDVVLMDVQMPNMDGLQATVEIRKREATTGKHIPIVALTAHARNEDRVRCLEAGMDGYLSKPFTSSALFEVLDKLLQQSVKPGISVAVQNVTEPKPAFDSAALLVLVDSDLEIFKEVIGAFLADCPKLLNSLQNAVSSKNAKALESSAHAFKGALRALAARPSAEGASKLEQMGKNGNLSGVETAVAEFKSELEVLTPQLEAASAGVS